MNNRALVRRPKGKSLVMWPRRRWEDNFKMGLQEMWFGDILSLRIETNRRLFLNAAINFRAPSNAENFLTKWEPVRFSRKTLLHGVSSSVIQSVSYGSSSSIDSTTLVGFGLLNYCWVFSAERFLQSAVASSTSNPPNLEDQWLERSIFRHQVSPTSETTRANPSSGRWNYGREISDNFAESGDS